MPLFSTDDLYKLLQQVAVLETKVQRLEINTEVNGLCGNDSTLPLTQNSGLENANIQLISSDTAPSKLKGCVLGNKSASISPPWNALGAKPKSKSADMGRRPTGRTQRPEICDVTGWPALTSYSTPVQSKTQPWIKAKGKLSNKAPKPASVQLQNRFAPLLQDPGSPTENLDNFSDSQRRDTNQNRRTAAILVLPHYLRENPSNIRMCEPHGETLDVAMNGMQVGLLIGHEGVLDDAFPLQIFNVAVVVEEKIVIYNLRDGKWVCHTNGHYLLCKSGIPALHEILI
ncbi:biliverdin reductase A isoform X3 [Chaetodon trifascialis]|uniref:biliverdin reductase A isoform X3 n=1 Tax=Chaetodon trifascialis TaxID=109706 RepID=UPI003994D335